MAINEKIDDKDLKYEPLEDSHASDLLPIWGDQDVIRYTSIKAPCTIEEIKDRIYILKEWDVFIVRSEGHVIGISGCPAMDREKRQFGIFYQFRKSSWGQGYATKAAGWLLDYMQSQYKECTIWADVIVGNIASEKILKHYGFAVVGEEVSKCNVIEALIRKFRLECYPR